MILYVLFPLLASASSNQVSNANDISWFNNLMSGIAGVIAPEKGHQYYKDGFLSTLVKNNTIYPYYVAIFAILLLGFVKIFHKPNNFKLFVKWIGLQFVVIMYIISMGSDFVFNPIVIIILTMLVMWIIWPVPHEMRSTSVASPDSKLGSKSCSDESDEDVELAEKEDQQQYPCEKIECCIGHHAFISTSLTAQASEISAIATEWMYVQIWTSLCTTTFTNTDI